MRELYRILLSLISAASLSAQAFAAAGDSPCSARLFETCTSVSSLTYTFSSTGNWTAASNGISDPTGTCLGTGSLDVNYWLSYTATADDQSIILNFTKPGGGGSIADCAIQVYSAASCSGPFTLVACQNNASDGNANSASITVNAGTTYYTRIFDASGTGSGNTFQASISITKSSIGQTACNARVISSLPYTYSSNTLCNGNTIAANCQSKTAGVSGTGEDFFFKYTSAGSEYISIELSGLNSTITQGVVVSNPVSSCSAVKTCYNLASANGTFPGGITGTSGSSSALCRTVYLSSAGDYYLIIDASASRGGPFSLSVSSYSPLSTSDACSWAQPVLPNSFSYVIDNCSSTKDHSPSEPDNPITAASGPSGCGYTSENSKWFSFIAATPAPPEIVVSVSGISCSTPDYNGTAGLEMGIFTGACGSSWTKVGSCATAASGTLTQTITSPPAGQTYYIVMDGAAGSICSFSISATNVTALPVSIVSFNAAFNGNAVDLTWESASETDNDHYTIERSFDGTFFSAISVIDAKGSGSQGHSYALKDNDIQPGIIYYRLKQTDNNGSSSFSKIASVDVPREEEKLEMIIVPNPASTEAMIMISGSEGASLIMISDALGKMAEQWLIASGDALSLSVQHYSPGIYWVTLLSNERVIRTRLLKTE
jgi:hypothetical protein